MDRTRLLLIDDHVLFRESLGRLLESEPDFEIAGQCGSGAEALEFLARDPVDLVLLDFNLPDGPGTSFIQLARQTGYGGKILIVTGEMDLEASSEALQLGASGIFLKHNPASSLLRAIRVTIAGDVWLDPKVVEFLAMRAPRPPEHGLMDALNERERHRARPAAGGLDQQTHRGAVKHYRGRCEIDAADAVREDERAVTRAVGACRAGNAIVSAHVRDA